ncbi:DEP domain-containing protein 1A-like [Ischnura elegans]|uniref:DEP domain-containing protein 1A-like n=1 Tax=Ischnura elegans TaxID=197161 RepID=UPI001ED86722|nr:DEP domain-containing protein 1A-like [Ischnura elegans]
MDLDNHPGPYRATKLWNEAICLFRNGMPLKRHRKHIKLYDSCFTGGEAVSWLHSTLKDNPNFGQEVTKDKTQQLLSKFYKVGVFQSVSNGSSDNLEAFKENELYRFCCRSPLRNIQLSSLASLSSQNPSNKGITGSRSKCAISQKFPKRSPSFQSHYLEEIKSRAESNQLKQMEIEEVWKTVVLGRLQALLGSLNVDDLLPSNQTSGARIMKNACLTNGLAPYQSFNRSQLFPRWILAAMKSLIDWPHLSRGASCSIWYPGFQVDVFKVIKDYFVNLESPLISTFLYSAFINSYAYVEYVESLPEFDECESNYEDFQDKSCLPSKSQENLVLNMTASGPNFDCHHQPIYYPGKHRESVSCYNDSYSDNCGSTLRRSRSRTPVSKKSSFSVVVNGNEASQCWSESQFYSAKKILSSTLPPNACFETAFTSDSPVTRIIPRKVVESIHVSHTNREKDGLSQKLQYCDPDPDSIKKSTSSHPCNSSVILCNIRRNSSAPNLLDAINSTSVENMHGCTTRTGRDGKIRDAQFSDSVGFPQVQCSDASHHSFSNYNLETKSQSPSVNKIKRTKSFAHDGAQQRSINRRKYPSDCGLNEKLHHVRNKSGGYVNIALSNSVDELDESYSFDHLLREDLDYDKALETLHKLIKCSYRDADSVSFLEGKGSDAYGNQSCSSTSSLWSYHTAASGEQSCSSSAAATSPNLVLDHSKKSPTAEELMNSGIRTVQGVQLGLDIFQLLLLLLPPVNRYKLHLLLYFMSNIINNGGLVLQDGICTKTLLLDTFTHSVLRPIINTKGDEGLARRLLSFFLDNHQALFQVSSGLQSEVNAHLVQLPHQVKPGSSGLPVTYCERITSKQFEEQKLAGSRLALAELLDQIIMDEKMGSKEKKKRLKMFREAYPHIYNMRFPSCKKDNEKLSKPKRILGFASLSRLKNMRI